MRDDDLLGGGRPAWRPAMPRVEAEHWARGSVYRDRLFHVTGAAAAEAIRQVGFDLRMRNFGQVWGDGVYATPDPQVIALYRAAVSASPVTLELAVSMHEVLSLVAFPGESRDLLRDRILGSIPNGYPAWILEMVRLRPVAGYAAPALAFGHVIRTAGYDGLEIIETQPSSAVGGTQVVVFDPRNVVVIANG